MGRKGSEAGGPLLTPQHVPITIADDKTGSQAQDEPLGSDLMRPYGPPGPMEVPRGICSPSELSCWASPHSCPFGDTSHMSLELRGFHEGPRTTLPPHASVAGSSWMFLEGLAQVSRCGRRSREQRALVLLLPHRQDLVCSPWKVRFRECGAGPAICSLVHAQRPFSMKHLWYCWEHTEVPLAGWV